jgi:ATP-dependent DNA helicase RecG
VDIDEALRVLKATGGDMASIEVKSGAGGFPQSAIESLSALANLPGGGTLIIGLDESAGFQPVVLPDPQTYMQTLGNKARRFAPPVQLDVRVEQVEGRDVIVADVRECDPSVKPCRVSSSGKAYVRSHDGDFEISALEEQGFLAARTAPHAERDLVDGTSLDDLDDSLLHDWMTTARRRDPSGLGRFGDDEMTVRAGVVARDGRLTKAGLLALGAHPQEHFPRAVVHVADRRDSTSAQRAKNIATFTGAAPMMLVQTLEWLTVNLGTRTVQTAAGGLKDEPELPLPALRELVANALVHRDLDAWSEGRAVELRLKPGALELTNPGGLYGVSVDRLGSVEVTSARNPRLLGICENVVAPDGTRVVEALASGLTTVRQELEAANLPAARYFDTGIMFTAVVSSLRSSQTIQTTRPTTPASTQLPAVGTNLRMVLDAVTRNPGRPVSDIAVAAGLPESAVRTALTSLRGAKWRLVRSSGGRGVSTTYELGQEA